MGWLRAILRGVLWLFGNSPKVEQVFVCCVECNHREECMRGRRCLAELLAKARELDTPVDRPKPGVK